MSAEGGRSGTASKSHSGYVRLLGLRAEDAGEFGCRRVEAVRRRIGHLIDGSNAHYHDQRQHDGVLNSRRARFIAQEFLEVGNHGSYPGKSAIRRREKRWVIRRLTTREKALLAASTARVAYVGRIATGAGTSAGQGEAARSGDDGWRDSAGAQRDTVSESAGAGRYVSGRSERVHIQTRFRAQCRGRHRQHETWSLDRGVRIRPGTSCRSRSSWSRSGCRT